MNEQRALENSAYIRKLLSEREPEFAAALAAAERYISWSSRPGGDEDRENDPYAAIPVRSCVLRRETVDVDGHALGMAPFDSRRPGSGRSGGLGPPLMLTLC